MNATTVCMIVFFLTTVTFALDSAREHQASQYALRLALHDERTAANLSAALNRCIEDKVYAAELDQDTTARDIRSIPLNAPDVTSTKICVRKVGISFVIAVYRRQWKGDTRRRHIGAVHEIL